MSYYEFGDFSEELDLFGEVLIFDFGVSKGTVKGIVDRNIGRLDFVFSLVLKIYDILGNYLN